MYLTSHLVKKATTGETAVNSFLHLHGEDVERSVDWTSFHIDELIQMKPGELVGETRNLKPGGNGVLSYLDIVAHDDASVEQIEAVLVDIKVHSDMVFPMTFRLGDVIVRFSVVYGLQSEAAEEFDELRRNAVSLLKAQRAKAQAA